MPVPPRFGNPVVVKFDSCVDKSGLMLRREARGPSCAGRNGLLLKDSVPRNNQELWIFLKILDDTAKSLLFPNVSLLLNQDHKQNLLTRTYFSCDNLV